MFRISRYLHAPKALPGKTGTPSPSLVPPTDPVVIWNLVRRCNLTCRHCYATSADKDFPGELSTQQVRETMEDLRRFGVPVLILTFMTSSFDRSDIFRTSPLMS